MIDPNVAKRNFVWLEANTSPVSVKQILVKCQLGRKTERRKVRHNFIEWYVPLKFHLKVLHLT